MSDQQLDDIFGDGESTKRARIEDAGLQKPAPLVLFRRKSKRLGKTSGTIPEEAKALLKSLEKGHRTDCYMKLKEGYVPAHCIILENAATIHSAFASNARESQTMTFDMSSWDSELVLDVIEMIYTNSTRHLLPLTTYNAIKLYELLIFLDHFSANKFLLRVAVSALYTMKKIDGAPRHCKNLDPTVSQLHIGDLDSDEPSKLQLVLYQALWIATEAVVPAFTDTGLDILVQLFCRRVFIRGSNNVLRYEASAYFCALSFRTLWDIVLKCTYDCEEYNSYHAIYFQLDLI